jgi:hypothetical protein
MKKPANSILLIPQKADTERGSVADAWQQQGGTVMRLDRFWEKPVIPDGREIAIYGNDTFALVVAQVLGVELVSPNDLLVTKIDLSWTKRRISTVTLGEITDALFPIFIKPVIPKQFKARVYSSPAELSSETEGLPPTTQLLLSEIVSIQAEARCFVLHHQVQDLALYEGHAPLTDAHRFVADFLASVPDLPSTFVLDIAYYTPLGWFVLEFNASWGAGLNHCDPQKVLSCILTATQKTIS